MGANTSEEEINKLCIAFKELRNQMGFANFYARHDELLQRGLSQMDIVKLMVAQGPDRKAGE